MEMSEKINEIATALSKAQGAIKNPPKERKAKIRTKAGRDIEYNYADLSDILDSVRGELARNNLATSQLIEFNRDDHTYWLTTILMHTSGQWMRASLEISVKAYSDQGASAQEIASGITYFRRYALCSILGISAEEDDDGAVASEKKPETVPVAKFVPEERFESQTQGKSALYAQTLSSIAKKKGFTMQQVATYIEEISGKKRASDLTEGEFQLVKTYLTDAQVQTGQQ